MENGENSPDEFFGSRRMTGIAYGVTDLLMGEEPAATRRRAGRCGWSTGLSWGSSSSRSPGWPGGARTILAGAPTRCDARWEPCGSRSEWACPCWRAGPWVLVVLVGLPRVIRVLLPAMLMGLPDLGYPLLASAVVAFGWGLARAVWAIRTLRTTFTPARRRPSTDATTQLSSVH